MASLLISKVNGIKVVQVGESKLSIENKSEDGGKVGGARKIGFVGDNINKTIDLGKGKQKHTLKLFVLDRSDNDTLFKVFHEDRYCTIIDKFKGKIKVYIDSIDVTDSDKHINRTVYDISCTVQDLDKAPSVNFTVKLTSTVTGMQGELVNDVSELTSLVGSFESKVNPLEFVDTSLNILSKGVDSILEFKSKAFGAYTAIKSKIDTGKRLFESVKNLKDFPDQFLDLVLNITEDSTTDITVTKTSNSVATTIGNVQKTQLIPISEPIIRGLPSSQVDVATISQIEVQSLGKDIIASRIVNKIKVIKDIKSMLAGGFNSHEDFESTVGATIERLDYVGYTQDEVSDKVYIIKSFANSQSYKDIIEIDVASGQPLAHLVYSRYGNLDNYSKIQTLNNFKDNDLITGKVKVFA